MEMGCLRSQEECSGWLLRSVIKCCLLKEGPLRTQGIKWVMRMGKGFARLWDNVSKDIDMEEPDAVCSCYRVKCRPGMVRGETGKVHRGQIMKDL